MEYKTYLIVPKERIGALIGKSGKVKKKIEDLTGVRLDINSKTGEVDVVYNENTAANALKAKNIIQAIARGFSPEKALHLVSDDIYLSIINIQDVIGKSKNAMLRQRARLIGTEGKARKMFETLTGTSISIYGKTVGIIGPLENLEIAKEGIIMLLNGTPHGDVYKHIQRRMQNIF